MPTKVIAIMKPYQSFFTGCMITRPGCRNKSLSKCKNLTPHPSWLYEMYNEGVHILFVNKPFVDEVVYYMRKIKCDALCTTIFYVKFSTHFLAP